MDQTAAEDARLARTGTAGTTDLAGNDTLGGGGGNDTLYGAAGEDTTVAGGGGDTFPGGLGEDNILSGNGEDTLTGGEDQYAGYFQDDEGNYYDDQGVLVAYANGEPPLDDTGLDTGDSLTGFGDNLYTDDNGDVWNLDTGDWVNGPEGDNTGDTTDYTGDTGDSLTGDEDTTDYSDTSDYTDDTGEDITVKNGGFIDLLYKKGGPIHMVKGGNVNRSGMFIPTGATDNGNGTYTDLMGDTYDGNGSIVSSSFNQNADATYGSNATRSYSPKNAPYGSYEPGTGSGWDNTTAATTRSLRRATKAAKPNYGNYSTSADVYPDEGSPTGYSDINGNMVDSTGQFVSYDNSGQLIDSNGEVIDTSNDQSIQDQNADNYMPAGAEDNGDGTYTLGNMTYDMQSDMPLYQTNEDGSLDVTQDNGDGTYTMGDMTYDMQSNMPLYQNNPDGSIDTVTDNGDGTYSIGDQTYDTQNNQPVYSTDENGQIVVNPDRVLSPDQNVDTSNTPVTNRKNKKFLSDQIDQTAQPNKVNQTTQDQQTTQNNNGILSSIKDALSGVSGSDLISGGMGALLGNLMSNNGGGNTNQGVDMNQLAQTQNYSGNPLVAGGGRNSGMVGGNMYVPYEQYAYWNPQNQRQLYADLGVSGYDQQPEDQYGDQYGEQTPEDQMQDESNPDYQNNFEDYLQQAQEEQPDQSALDEGMVAPEEPQYASGGSTHYTFGKVITPQDNLGMKRGGLSMAHTMHSHMTNPIKQGRIDFSRGSAVNGAGDGQSDDIPAMLADGEYVFDADTVAQLGNGSNKAGAKALDKMREAIRAHKRAAPINKIPPKAKSPLAYLKESLNG